MNNLPNKTQELAGWGNFPRETCRTYRPEKSRDLHEIYINQDKDIIARGMGMSYGDAALNANGVTDTSRLDKFLEFDIEKGIITAQSGVTLADIIDVAAPKGWFPAVIPGTKYVSLGGAFASNVHGKNHLSKGDFADHVTSIKLILPNGSSVTCSPDKKSDLFWATAGGMGMTGCIEELTIQLMPIKSLSLKAEAYKVANIHQMIDAFIEARENAEYMVGWIDHFGRDESLGRGVFESANHITLQEGGTALADYKTSTKGIKIPKRFPSSVLNKYSMSFYNKLRFFKYSTKKKSSIIDFNTFFHPLDSLKNWNNLYGKNGFFQYQPIIPDSKNVADNLREILSIIQESGHFSYLAIIKYHAKSNGLLSYPIQGYSLALDFPNNEQTRELIDSVNNVVCKMGGRVYLAKDSLLEPHIFAEMYNENLDKWRDIINKNDPDKKINSAMAQRLKLRGKNVA